MFRSVSVPDVSRGISQWQTSLKLKLVCLGMLWAATAPAQIYVVNSGDGTIGEYSLTGQSINTSFITGLSSPTGIAISGGYLYVAQENGVVQKYTTGGSLVNASLISGLSLPWGLTVSGNHLFIADAGEASNTIGEYTTEGDAINASLVTGLATPADVATDGNYLYVTCWQTGTIGVYTTSGDAVTTFDSPGACPGGIVLDGNGHVYVSALTCVGEYTMSGAPINPNLISGGYNSGIGIALDGSGDLFLADNSGGGNVIREYTTGGQLINANFITGLNNPVAIAVVVPEPATFALLLIGLAGVMLKSASHRA